MISELVIISVFNHLTLNIIVRLIIKKPSEHVIQILVSNWVSIRTEIATATIADWSISQFN